ncbi:MAG: PilZ domain-containing protein [Bacillota bacterium]
MPTRNTQGVRRTANGPDPGSTSTYSILSGLRGMAVHLLFLALATPRDPVSQVNGEIEEVRTGGLVLAVDSPLPPLEPHIRFGVEVFTPSGMVQFQARPAAPVEEGSTRLFLALPGRVETVQRRRFARAPFSGDITFQLVQAGKPLPSIGKGTGVDLSGGGLKLVSPTPLRQGQELLVSFQTPDRRSHRGILARVVRVEPQAGQYAIACRFEALGEAEEAALVQAVFRMQVRSAGR